MTLNIAWDASTNLDTMKTLLKDVFDSADRKAMYEADMVVNDISVSDYYERKMRMTSISQSSVVELADGQEIPLADPIYGSTKDWVQVRHGLGCKITSGMKKYNKIGLVKKNVRALKKAMREYKDVDIATMINNATSTTAGEVGYDGLALASTAHTTLGAGGDTYSNYGDAALGVGSLQSAINSFDTLVDDQGDEIIVRPTKLICHPSRRWTARELLGSSKKPGSADNDINAIQDWDLSYDVYHRSNSSSFWALLAKGDENYDLFVYTSQEPDFKMGDYPDLSRSTVITSEQYFVKGFGDPRGFYLGDA